ncbi:MAG: serine/threonine protein kinase [Myxococcales bacterium]|nr:serine/threonine protein kinase [Myxococcales bacterium]
MRCRRCGIKFEVVRSETRASSDVASVDPDAPREARPRPPQKANQAYRMATGELPKGTELDGYVVDEPLGRGAMGTVYRGRQLSLQRPVAIKVMSTDLVEQPEFILRFRREAAALASLSHENVVAIIDQGRLEQWCYFVMEYIEGPTLRRVISRRGLRMSVALDLALQVGRGLDYAHGKGVVHRDLKPENVLIADRGSAGYLAKICDFGLADLLYSDRSFVNLTGSRISMGTINYMAPEQRQDAGRVDQRADVFSFGVMLYEIFTGELPLGRFPRPSVKNPRLDARLDGVILKALEPDARRRYPRVRDISDALSAVLR